MCKKWFEKIWFKIKEHFNVENMNYYLHNILKKKSKYINWIG